MASTTNKRAKIEEENYSPLFLLPEDVFNLLFGLLPKEQILQFRLVCKKGKQVVDATPLWKDYFQQRFHSNVKEKEPPWNQYFRRCFMQKRWEVCLGNRQSIEASFKCICSLAFDDKHIYTGSEECSINQHSVETGQKICNFYGHDEAVWGLSLKNELLASAGGDGRVIIWNTKKNKTPLHKFQEHKGESFCVNISHIEGIAASGGADSTLNIYDLEKGKKIRSRLGHSGPVFCVHIHENLVGNGSADGTVQFLDLRAPLESVFSTKSSRSRGQSKVFSLQFDSEVCVFGCGKALCIQDMRMEKFRWAECHWDGIYSVKFDLQHIVTGSADESLNVFRWRNKSSQLIEPLYSIANYSSVFCVGIDEKKILCGDKSGHLCRYDFSEDPNRWNTLVERITQRERKVTMLGPVPATDGKLDYSIF